jgi:hypothetical protein
MKSHWKVTLKRTANIYCPRFGEIAVERGFITAEQLKHALSEQVDNHFAHKTNRLLGEVLFHKGWMTIEQIEIVLNECCRHEKISREISRRRNNKKNAST